MKTTYSVKNFKIFDKKGATVPIAPLTFLVGCNSSGKSSIVKSLTLLKTHLNRSALQGRRSFVDSYLDFNVRPNESLGKFQKVINENIHRNKDKVITLEYTVYSYYAKDNIRVSLSFIEGELGNGKLSTFAVFNSKGETILDADSDGHIKTCDLSLLKEAFMHYVPARTIAHMLKPWPANNVPRWVEHSDSEQEPIEAMREKYNPICGSDYIEEVIAHRDNLCNIILSEKDSKAFTKFEQTGILQYFSVLDEIGTMNPNEVRDYIMSKTRKGSVFRELFDRIIDDFTQTGEKDFMSFYRMKEDLYLTDKFVAKFFVSEILFGIDPHFEISLRRQIALQELEEGNFAKTGPTTLGLIRTCLCLCFAKGDEYIQHNENDMDVVEHNIFLTHFRQFLNMFLEEVLFKDVTEGLSYVSSSRVQVRRIYTLEDTNEFSEMVKSYYELATEYNRNNIFTVFLANESHEEKIAKPFSFSPESFISKWIKAFGIGEKCCIQLDENGVGFVIKVFKSETDRKGVLLADMGYGITQLFSILLQIEVSIMTSRNKKLGYHFVEENYLRILSPQTIAIEEPEIHLHPRYQALLAEMFYDAYKEYNIQFIIETHSEYLLRKIQTIIGAKKLTPDEVSMIYVEEPSEVQKGAEKIRRIPIKVDGRLSEPFGPGFYDEADNLALDLFTNMAR